MAKLERKTQKIFGASAGNRSFTAFGTAKSDNPTYTQDLDLIQNNAYNYGWEAAVLEDRAPYEEDTNGLIYMLTYQLAYLMQQGAAIEYDPNTTYFKGSIVSSTDGTGTWYKSLTDDNIGNALSNSAYWQIVELAKNGIPLFTQITTDHILTGDDAIGWAMQGSEVLSAVYPDAYSKILSLYNSGTDVTYRGITAKRTADGRYVADISQQTAVNSLFSNTGIADFYLINQTEQSFYLPKTSKFIQYTSDTSTLNNFIEAGLPALDLTISGKTNTTGNHSHTRGTMDITGRIFINGNGSTSSGLYISDSIGALYTSNKSGSGTGYTTARNSSAAQYINFQASRNWTGSTSTNGNHSHTVDISSTIGNPIYGKNISVQPPASLRLLYYRVGNTAV